MVFGAFSYNMVRVANSVNWMHYKPLNSLNGTVLAMNSPSGLIFQLVLIYIGPGTVTPETIYETMLIQLLQILVSCFSCGCSNSF